MRRILITTILLLLAGSAHAGDFTGFYAGINAGYARGHARERTTGESPALLGKPETDLPPSARDAALALRRSDAGRAAGQSGH